MFNRTIRTLYTTARALAEQPVDPASAKAAARSLGFSNVKRTRQLPSLDIPTTGGANIFGAGAGSRPPSDGYERRPRNNGPRDGQRDRRPRQDARPAREDGDRPRRPRQDGDRPPRQQQGERRPRRQEARQAQETVTAEAAPAAPAAPAAEGANFFEGIDLATMTDSAPQRAPRGDRPPRGDRAPRGDRPPRTFEARGGANRRGPKRAGPPVPRMESRKEREAEQKRALANFGDYRRLAANAASVPLVQPPAAGSSYDMFGPRSISLSVPTGFSEKEIEGMMQLTGGKRWKVEQTALLARLGDYSLFSGRIPQTLAGPHGAAQRAKFELRKNKSYDPATQSVPAMKIVTDAVGVDH